MRRYLSALFFPFMLCSTAAAFADDYPMRCYLPGGMACDKLGTNVISKKLADKYPASQWMVVVVADFERYPAGGGTGFAFAGIAPVTTDAVPATVPARRFLVTANVNDGQLSPNEVEEKIGSLALDAVKDLVYSCEQSPECEVQ